jgi:hypothetical protein
MISGIWGIPGDEIPLYVYSVTNGVGVEYVTSDWADINGVGISYDSDSPWAVVADQGDSSASMYASLQDPGNVAAHAYVGMTLTSYYGLGMLSVQVPAIAGGLILRDANGNTPNDCGTISRGTSTTPQLYSAGNIRNINWSFSGGGGTVTHAGGLSWPGTMAVSGRITVTFDVGNQQGQQRWCDVTVNARGGWSITEPSAVHETTNTGSWHPVFDKQFRVVNGIQQTIGYSRANLPTATTNLTRAQIPSGPNQGVWYATGNASLGGASYYYWDIDPDITNAATTFYHNLTCNNWDANMNPYGYTTPQDLATNVEGHEHAFSPESHYAEFVTAMADAGNNPGTITEATVRFGGTFTDWDNVWSTAVSAGVNRIYAAASVEPDNPLNPTSVNFKGYYHVNLSTGNYLNTCP